jgi:hypothetical protein
MACSAKLRNRVIIRRYDQLSEFGYCLHNVSICVRRFGSVSQTLDFL